MNNIKLDILVLAAHPDDAELSCSGTILKHIQMGKKVGIIDLTQGELGSRGTVETRYAEAKKASEILGISVRENLQLADGFFQNDKESQLAIIRMIRKYQPEIVLANAINDRHPDHGKGARVAVDACFLSGLRMIETNINGEKQALWRPKNLYHYIQDQYIMPDFVVDISEFWETKKAAIRAYETQFFSQNADLEASMPVTYISTPEFLEFLEARAKELGHQINVKYGEGFTKTRILGVENLFDLK